MARDYLADFQEVEQDQNWPIAQVRVKTGLYFDGSYLHKIMTGKLSTPSVTQAICEILEIQLETQTKED